VKPVVILSKYGQDATRYPGRIRRMIDSIRRSVAWSLHSSSRPWILLQRRQLAVESI